MKAAAFFLMMLAFLIVNFLLLHQRGNIDKEARLS